VIPDTFADSNLKGEKGSTAFYLYPDISWEEVMERYEGSIMQGRYRQELTKFRTHHDRPPRPMEIRVPGLYQDLQWIGAFPAHSREWAGQWSANYSVHTHAFFDVVLDGEDHYQEPPNQKDFIDYWPLPHPTARLPAVSVHRTGGGPLTPGWPAG
jgi:hypothetical protein